MSEHSRSRSIVAALALLSVVPAPVLAAPLQPAYEEGTLLVRFAPQTDERARGRRRASVQAGRLRDLGRLVPGLEVWSLPKHVPVAAAMARLRGAAELVYAEPDYVFEADAIPNDPSFGSLWGLHNTGQAGGVADADIDAVEAWDTTIGSAEVIVGVVDSGVDYRHPDLAASIWTNPREIAGNGVDDDRNGYIDDVHGWNALADNGDPLDDHGHGTHVAGTIAARGNDGIGVAGVAWAVKVMPLKFLSASGSGTAADAIQAIDYAVAQKRAGVNVRVLNNSWGGGAYSRALLDSITAAGSADILFVAASGNAAVDTDGSPHYPSSYDAANIVSVAATTRTDALAAFSNYGSATVDLGAPGAEILSTTPNKTYATWSGTSMAAPHVSGVAGLMASLDPAIPVGVLSAKLLQSVDPIPALRGKTVTGGRLNAQRALAAIGPAVPAFYLTTTPTYLSVAQGQSATFAVAVTPSNGFTGAVSLSLSSTPALAGATATYAPNSVSAGSSSVLTVSTSAATPAGTYELTLTGASGGIVRTASAALVVDPAGTATITYANGTNFRIPDGDVRGIVSTIDVPDAFAILGASVSVDITHPFIGDLEVALTSPSGTRVILYNRTGGAADDIHQTWAVPAFEGQQAAGTWLLSVRDVVSVDAGRLEGWSLTLKGVVSGTAPTKPGKR